MDAGHDYRLRQLERAPLYLDGTDPFAEASLALRFEEIAAEPGEPGGLSARMAARVLVGAGRPVHEIVNVDLFLPGCPPPSEAIYFVLGELLEGRIPDPKGKTRFGA